MHCRTIELRRHQKPFFNMELRKAQKLHIPFGEELTETANGVNVSSQNVFSQRRHPKPSPGSLM